MNLPPPPSVIELVKDNTQADMLWKQWLVSVFESRNYEYIDFESVSTAATIGKTLTIVDSSSGAVTVTLPPAVDYEKKAFTIKRVGANNVTIDGDGSETIDGALTLVLSTNYDYAKVYSDGAEWHRI